MAREEEFEYESSSAPGTPRNSGNDEKKKRNGLRKLISFPTKKSPNDLDKSERGIGKEDGGGSPSGSRRFNFFKRPRSLKDEDGAHPPTKKEESKPESNEKTQNLSEINKGLQEKDRPRNEALKEETKASKHNLPAEKIGEVLKLSEKTKEDNQNHPHKQTQAIIDDKGKSKEHQELKVVANEVQDKGVVKHDQQNHHKQTEDHKGDAKDEKSVATSEVVEEQSRDLGCPPIPVLQEDGVGCESLAKGLQKICLPWTINKEDH